MRYLSKLSVLAYCLIISSNSSAQGQLGDPQTTEIVPDHLAYLYAPSASINSHDTPHQLYAGERRWEKSRRLRVCFYNGNPVVTKLIRTVAAEWNSYSSVTFDFGPEGSWINCLNPLAGFPEIRVGFSERGYWSYVGSDSERYGGERAPSMNFDSFNRIYNELKYTPDDVVVRSAPYHRATIKHEFGHALGLLHELQNPSLDCFHEIKWFGPGNVYESLGGDPNNWTKEMIDRNLGLIKATDPDYVKGAPDPKSVMMYSLPSSIFKDGDASKCAVPVNYEISEKDKKIISIIYPVQDINSKASMVVEAISAAYVKPAPQFIAQNEASEYMKSIVVDLESDDTATRRNARARLSQILAQNNDANKVSELIFAMPNSSYRYKLGVAVALGKQGKKYRVQNSLITILKQQASSTSDLTLGAALKSAQKNLELM